MFRRTKRVETEGPGMQGTGREVVIVEAVRTPIGRGHPEKGYYKDTHRTSSWAPATRRSSTAPGSMPPRSRTSSAAACSSTASRCSTSGATRGCRPGCRWRRRPPPSTASAAPPSRPSTSAPRSSPPACTTSSSAAASSTWATSRWASRSSGSTRSARPGPPALMERYNLVPQGISAEMIADKWEIPRSELDELAAALAPARPPGDRGGPLRARDDPVQGQRLDLRLRPGHPARHDAWRRSRA